LICASSILLPRTFFPGSYSAEQLFLAWGCFGGTPYYLDGVDMDNDLGTVIQQSLLSRQGFLHDEPDACFVLG